MVGSTLASIKASARDLSFDRFVTPTFFIKGAEGQTVTITSTSFLVKDASGNIVSQFDFSVYITLDSLVKAIIADSHNYAISYSASFIGSEPSNSLLVVTSKPINEIAGVYRQYFFSDTEIEDILIRYFAMKYNIDASLWGTTPDYDLNKVISEEVKSPQTYQMALWCAYWLVDKRRLYELAGEVLSQSTFSYTGANEMIGVSDDGSAITVQVGDVFTYQTGGNINYNEENPVQIGSDNVLGDAASFWYKLCLWLRDHLERLFGDFSLRKDTILFGEISLTKDQNFYAYYDNYPYTISPLSREILSSMERGFF